jgi:hypothetical protein
LKYIDIALKRFVGCDNIVATVVISCRAVPLHSLLLLPRYMIRLIRRVNVVRFEMTHAIAVDLQKVYREMAPRCRHPTLAVPASVSANVSYYILNGI